MPIFAGRWLVTYLAPHMRRMPASCAILITPRAHRAKTWFTWPATQAQLEESRKHFAYAMLASFISLLWSRLGAPASRPYLKGYLKLSFVSCPIALYPAISAAERISFRQVNRRTGHRLKEKLIDSVTGQAIDAADKARGYEVGENEFLLVEDRNLEQARRAPGAW